VERRDNMRALVYHGPGKLSVEERPAPNPQKNEVQIQIKACSICGSDLGAYKHASDRFMPPLVLGHEFAGVVTAVGKDVTGLMIGDRVSVNPMLYCEECFSCGRKEYNLCGNRKSLGTAIGGAPTDGGLQEFINVRESAVFKLRDEVSYEEGALLEPMGVCLNCAKTGMTDDEDEVLVIGAGPIGLLIVKFLKALGIKNVMVSDILEKRLQKAEEFGASYTINSDSEDVTKKVLEITNNKGADRVIIAAGIGEIINQSFDLVRNGGVIVLVALMHEMVTIDPMQIVGRGLKFFGSYMFQREQIEAMNLLADGKLGVKDIITSSFDVEEAKKAFDILSAPNDEIKVQVTF